MNERKALNERIPEYLFDRIHEAIGHASMCWESYEEAGTFDAKQASDVAFELCHFIADFTESTDEEKQQKQKEYKSLRDRRRRGECGIK